VNSEITSDLEELPPQSSLPWVWFGFALASSLFVCEFLDGLLDLDHAKFRLLLILLLLASWIYWLFCVARFHTILHEISRHQYPVTGPEAAGKHFIPFYNLYWICKWPVGFCEYINSRGRVKMVSGYFLGVLLLACIPLRFFDVSLSLFGTFGVGLYISAKLRRHVYLIKGPEPGMLPPLPDANMWRATNPP
jgi:hypothetical protein